MTLLIHKNKTWGTTTKNTEILTPKKNKEVNEKKNNAMIFITEGKLIL